MAAPTTPSTPPSPTAASADAAIALAADFAAKLERVLPLVLAEPSAAPDDWAPTATTYDLPRFDSEAQFARRLDAALTRIEDEGVTEPAAVRELLRGCGLPYDYARLGQPLSTVYELWLQAQTSAARVFSFASATKPWLAVIEAPDQPRPVRVVAEGTLPISAALRAQLVARGVELCEHHAPAAGLDRRVDTVTVRVLAARPAGDVRALGADAVCYPVANGGVLLICDPTRIPPRGIQIVRKRTVSALLAADAQRELARAIAHPLPPEATATSAACDVALRALFPEVTDALYFCTGLAAEAAVFAAAVDQLGPGPVTFFYAQNGYGGTGQLITDLLAPTTALVPAPLPVMAADADGNPRTLVDGIVAGLAGLDGGAACVFIETPTNPELQVHDVGALLAAVRAYQARTGRAVPILVDTTLAPLYPALAATVAQDWPFVLVKSGSKYFTKGKTTLGVAACGAAPLARAIVARARELGRDADAFAKPGQLAILRDGLVDLRPRMAAIAGHTTRLADGLRRALAARGHAITLYAITPAQVEAGLACGLISFYLPPAPTTYADLVDEFVAHLLAAAPALVKSRVSYGQSTGGGAPDWFYVINPEESTQGALSAAVKAAQKRDNVQICRISVPAIADVDGLLAAMEPFFDRKYGPRTARA
ncbi:MAG: PLP-dependent transferase [Kofleriaceae bacterium]